MNQEVINKTVRMKNVERDQFDIIVILQLVIEHF